MYIQEISKELSISKKAINLYEEKGLIKPHKDEKGYRVYLEQEKETLLKIKQLRKLGFTIEEIKTVLLKEDYSLFDDKKKEYQTKIFQIDTSIQYIDLVKDAFIKNENIKELSQEMNEIFDLEEAYNDVNGHQEIDFDKVSFMLMIGAWICAMKVHIYFFYILSCLLFMSAYLISSFSSVRVWIYKILKIFKK